MSDGRPIFLVGFMGSGKSTVGRRLARLLARELVDTDAEVERTAGRSIAEVVRTDGEAAFREAEWRALESLDGRAAYVAATGGGIVEARRARCWMRDRGPIVWLRIGFETVRARVGSGGGRPLWRADRPLEMRSLFERRSALYALADIFVDAESGDAGEVASRVRERLRTSAGDF